ncbi:MAG: hypothetical protein WC868_07745 [Bacteroidales bacterium]
MEEIKKNTKFLGFARLAAKRGRLPKFTEQKTLSTNPETSG